MSSNSHDQHSRPKRISDDTSAAHTIVRAMEEMGYDIDDAEAFIQRVQHVEYGLSAEIEFAALLRWLGNCPFVHRLSEDALSEPSQSNWQIPDLLAVFRSGELACSAAIEVKTTESHTLKLKADYIQRLKSYAALIGQPLLIAWRPRNIGFWVLVDPENAKKQSDSSLELDLDTAVKNDLMSLVAGDHYIVPTKGAGLVLEASRIGEKKPTPHGYEAVFRIDNALFVDGKGERISQVPDPIIWVIFSSMEESQEATDSGLVQRFLASGGMDTRAIGASHRSQFSSA